MKEIDIKELNINPYNLFGSNWALLAAGNSKTNYNTMTIAWGQIGSLWSKKGKGGTLPIISVYVRPQRYTKVFMDKEEYFSVSFFDDSYKKTLSYLGSHSGKDEDKVSKVGLTPFFLMIPLYLKNQN